jgi:hypothetical protein
MSAGSRRLPLTMVFHGAVETSPLISANASLAAMRAAGSDPTNTPTAAAKRSASLSGRKREERDWQPGQEDDQWTRERYELEILPALAAIPLSTIMQATGLSISACSRIRAGKLVPIGGIGGRWPATSVYGPNRKALHSVVGGCEWDDTSR